MSPGYLQYLDLRGLDWEIVIGYCEICGYVIGVCCNDFFDFGLDIIRTYEHTS